MPFNLRLSILIIALILAAVILKVLHKDMIPVKYSLLWGIGVILLIILSIWPNILVSLANLIGFQTISNKKKITLLIQEVSILKNEINKRKDI